MYYQIEKQILSIKQLVQSLDKNSLKKLFKQFEQSLIVDNFKKNIETIVFSKIK